MVTLDTKRFSTFDKGLACLAAILCLVAGTAAGDTGKQAAEFDRVELVSGELLVGELIALYEDELLFESEILDRLAIDWEDVRSFEGRGTFRISVTSGQTVNGELRIDEAQVLVGQGGERRRFARADLVSITPSAYRERDNWSAQAMLGFNARSGNADTVEYNLLANLQRRTPRSRIRLDYLGNFNETDNVETANNHRLNGSWDLFGGSDWFWRPLLGQYYRDAFQNIRHQLTLETGLGYQVLDTPATDWSISGGLGVNLVNYFSVQPGQDSRVYSPALSLGTDFETELSPWLDYVLAAQVTFLDEDSGRYQHHLLTGLSTDLPGLLDFNVSFIWDRIAEPQVREDGSVPEKDDFRILLGIGLEY